MEITRETDYAIRCILFLAERPERTFMVGEIAEKQQVPKPFLAKILQKLARAEIVTSTRGVKGGYRLAEPPEKISILNVIEAVQGPVAFNRCVVDQESCERREYCSVHPVWVELQAEVTERLGVIDFGKLIRREKALIEDRKNKSKRRRV